MSDINKYSILDIDGAADVVNNLLDKLGTAVGWGVNRETPERIAIATYIEDIKNSDYDSLLKAALISQAKKTIKEYCNQKDVVGFAINELREGANPQKVDLFRMKYFKVYGERFLLKSVMIITVYQKNYYIH